MVMIAMLMIAMIETKKRKIRREIKTKNNLLLSHRHHIVFFKLFFHSAVIRRSVSIHLSSPFFIFKRNISSTLPNFIFLCDHYSCGFLQFRISSSPFLLSCRSAPLAFYNNFLFRFVFDLSVVRDPRMNLTYIMINDEISPQSAVLTRTQCYKYK